VLRFEVAPETFPLFNEALHRLRRAAGGSLDDDAALLSMARQCRYRSTTEGSLIPPGHSDRRFLNRSEAIWRAEPGHIAVDSALGQLILLHRP
jgi:hypothetical protein